MKIINHQQKTNEKSKDKVKAPYPGYLRQKSRKQYRKNPDDSGNREKTNSFNFPILKGMQSDDSK